MAKDPSEQQPTDAERIPDDGPNRLDADDDLDVEDEDLDDDEDDVDDEDDEDLEEV